jgi:hypothetical protein
MHVCTLRCYFCMITLDGMIWVVCCLCCLHSHVCMLRCWFPHILVMMLGWMVVFSSDSCDFSVVALEWLILDSGVLILPEVEVTFPINPLNLSLGVFLKTGAILCQQSAILRKYRTTVLRYVVRHWESVARTYCEQSYDPGEVSYDPDNVSHGLVRSVVRHWESVARP